MEKNICTHDMVFENGGEKIVFGEWFERENGEGYYVEMCNECYEKYADALGHRERHSLLDPVFPICTTNECERFAECMVFFMGDEVSFAEKPED